jgi:ATP/maltotriose-dependent transcriptional regulator MalT
LLTLGQIALSQADVVRARTLFEESLALGKESEYEPGIAEALSLLGKVLSVQGDHVTAYALYKQSLTIATKLDEKELVASGLEGLAGVVAAQGEPTWAAQLWGAAETLRDTIGMPISPVECADHNNEVAAARLYLGEKAFAAAWTEGRAMTPHQALAAREQATIPAPNPLVSDDSHCEGITHLS